MPHIPVVLLAGTGKLLLGLSDVSWATGTQPERYEINIDKIKEYYEIPATAERINNKGFYPQQSLDDGIRQLIKGYQMLPSGSFRNA